MDGAGRRFVIEVRATGLVHRNPRPELRSFHAWHPSIVRFDDGELVCVFDGASADQALDYRAYVTCSADGGATWSTPERVLADWGDRPTTHLVRASRVSDEPDGGVFLTFWCEEDCITNVRWLRIAV